MAKLFKSKAELDKWIKDTRKPMVVSDLSTWLEDRTIEDFAKQLIAEGYSLKNLVGLVDDELVYLVDGIVNHHWYDCFGNRVEQPYVDFDLSKYE